MTSFCTFQNGKVRITVLDFIGILDITTIDTLALDGNKSSPSEPDFKAPWRGDRHPSLPSLDPVASKFQKSKRL
jgi:hypothetical protein